MTSKVAKKTVEEKYKNYKNSYEKAVENRMNVLVIDVENKSIAEIANEIYNSLLVKKEFIK